MARTLIFRGAFLALLGAITLAAGGSSSEPTFTLACSPSPIVADAGGTGSSTCTLTSTEGFTASVDLSTADVPGGGAAATDIGAAIPGVTFSFDPNPATLPADGSVDSLMSAAVDSSVPPGVYEFQVVATGGGVTQTFNTALVVQRGHEERPPFNGVPDFNLPEEPSIKPSCACDPLGYMSGIGQAAATAGPGMATAFLGGEDPGVCTKCEAVGDFPSVAQDAGAFSVYLHSGEFFYSVVDLEIPGRGFNWRLERKYRTGVTFDGPLGRNWELNYNRRLVEANPSNLAFVQLTFPAAKVGDVARMDGHARADLYVQNADGSYTAPTGYYTRLRKNSDGSFNERDYRGSAVEYGLADPDGIARMTSLSDRNGNTMRFEYDTTGRLVRVLDTYGRAVDYRYDAQGHLEEVEDFTGRIIKFGYADGNLLSVTSPAVTGTPTGNDFPDGRMERYAYSSGFADERLNNNLLTITAPNEVAVDGPPRVHITYDDDVSSQTVDQVLTQTVGGTNASAVPAGGTIAYAYATLAAPDPADINLAVSQTTVTDRSGNETEYRFNTLGNIVRIRELTNRNVRSSDPAFYEASYEYSPEGELLRQINSEGNTIEYDYADESANRFQQGNLRSETQKPDPDRGGDQAFLKTTRKYEPLYNQIRAVTDPRGNDPSYVPQNGGARSAARYTTVFTYDYQEGKRFAALASKLGLTRAEVIDRLSSAGIPMGLGDVNRDGLTNQINGNVIRIVHPSVRLLPACRSDRLSQASVNCSLQARREDSSQQPVVELFAYNGFGQVVRSTDPERNVDRFEYYPASDPDGDGAELIAGAGDSTSGYLKQLTRDSVGAASRDSGTNPRPVRIRTRLLYNNVGELVREVDGRGIGTDYVVNELNEVVQTTRAAAHGLFTPDPTEPLALTDFQYVERLFYDFNGNRVRRQVEDRGNTSTVGADNAESGTSFVDYSYGYDILDNRISLTEEVSDSEDLLTRYRYDANENPVLQIHPAGNATSSSYDERDLLFESTAGAVAPPPGALLSPADPADYDVRGGSPATTTLHYDENRNLAERVDAADTDGSAGNNSDLGGSGDRTRIIYDGFDRRTSVVDSLGNQEVRQYDPAGNVLLVARFGAAGGASPTADGPDTLAEPVSAGGVVQAGNLVTPNLLEARKTAYDELSRLFRTDRALFVNTIATSRPADVADGASGVGKLNLTPRDTCAIEGMSAPPSGYLGCVTTRTEYDRSSRATFTIQDDGDVSRRVHDGADRVIKRIDPDGNIVETAYDDADNVIETRETDRSQVRTVPSEIFLTTSFYDSLGRIERRVNNVGHTRDYRYDSRDNLVAKADAKGPPGPGISRRAFTPGPRTVNTTNNFGNVTRNSYDGIGRPTQEEVTLTASGEGDGSQIGASFFGVKTDTPTPDLAQGGGDGRITTRHVWDANSQRAALIDDNGNRAEYAYDNLDRLTTETKGICVPPALADRCDLPTTIAYAYDGDDNVSLLTDENGTETKCEFDAGNRRISCDIARASGVAGTTAVTYEYDGLSRLTRATDNNDPALADDDSIVARAYDSLGRFTEERQQIGLSAAKALSSAWRAEALRVALTYPNGRVVDFRYDRLDRLSTIRDLGSAAPIADYDYIGADRVLERKYPIGGTRLTYLNTARTRDAGYDGLRRPVNLRHIRTDESLLVGFRHSYDRMNNKLSERKLHDAKNGEVYAYDSGYRLTDFDRPNGGAILPTQTDWEIDGVGNWQQVSAETRKHSSFNEIIERSTSGETTPIISDDDGNVIDDGAYALTFDYANRLRTVMRKADDAVVASYSYDALGRRIRKVVTNSGALDGTTDFYLDGWQEIEERNAAGALVQQYVQGAHVDELLVLDRNTGGGSTATGRGDRRFFYYQNAIGSVFALTNKRAKVVEAYQYDAYGRPGVYRPGPNGIVDFGGDDPSPVGFSALGNPFLFTGRRLDAETSLYHYRARELNVDHGRFLQRDPAAHSLFGPSPANLYSYVAEAPTNWVDPLGTQPWGPPGYTQEEPRPPFPGNRTQPGPLSAGETPGQRPEGTPGTGGGTTTTGGTTQVGLFCLLMGAEGMTASATWLAATGVGLWIVGTGVLCYETWQLSTAFWDWYYHGGGGSGGGGGGGGGSGTCCFTYRCTDLSGCESRRIYDPNRGVSNWITGFTFWTEEQEGPCNNSGATDVLIRGDVWCKRDPTVPPRQGPCANGRTSEPGWAPEPDWWDSVTK